MGKGKWVRRAGVSGWVVMASYPVWLFGCLACVGGDRLGEDGRWNDAVRSCSYLVDVSEVRTGTGTGYWLLVDWGRTCLWEVRFSW